MCITMYILFDHYWNISAISQSPGWSVLDCSHTLIIILIFSAIAQSPGRSMLCCCILDARSSYQLLEQYLRVYDRKAALLTFVYLLII